jgi:hypothetical protein
MIDITLAIVDALKRGGGDIYIVINKGKVSIQSSTIPTGKRRKIKIVQVV